MSSLWKVLNWLKPGKHSGKLRLCSSPSYPLCERWFLGTCKRVESELYLVVSLVTPFLWAAFHSSVPSLPIPILSLNITWLCRGQCWGRFNLDHQGRAWWYQASLCFLDLMVSGIWDLNWSYWLYLRWQSWSLAWSSVVSNLSFYALMLSLRQGLGSGLSLLAWEWRQGEVVRRMSHKCVLLSMSNRDSASLEKTKPPGKGQLDISMNTYVEHLSLSGWGSQEYFTFSPTLTMVLGLGSDLRGFLEICKKSRAGKLRDLLCLKLLGHFQWSYWPVHTWATLWWAFCTDHALNSNKGEGSPVHFFA